MLLPYQLSLRHIPAVLRRIVDRIPPSKYDQKLAEDRFTLREMVAHLADSEPMFLRRMREAVERNEPTFERVDVMARARQERFAERDLYAELDAFALRRAETVEFLEGLSEAQLARRLTQSFGTTSIEAFVALLSGHDVYHLEQASAYLDAEGG